MEDVDRVVWLGVGALLAGALRVVCDESWLLGQLAIVEVHVQAILGALTDACGSSVAGVEVGVPKPVVPSIASCLGFFAAEATPSRRVKVLEVCCNIQPSLWRR